MTAQEQWLVANAAWLAAGLVITGAVLGSLAVLVVRGLRKRSAEARERRAKRFRSAVRSEARRLAAEGARRRRVVEEVDDHERTRVFEWPRPAAAEGSVTASGERRRTAAIAEMELGQAKTTVFDRLALLGLGDEAG